MLIQVAEGVLVHQSNLLQTNAVVVQGRAGVLRTDPGVRGDEMTCLANDLREMGQPGHGHRAGREGSRFRVIPSAGGSRDLSLATTRRRPPN